MPLYDNLIQDYMGMQQRPDLVSGNEINSIPELLYDYIKQNALFGAFNDQPRPQLSQEQMVEEVALRALDAVTPFPMMGVTKSLVNPLVGYHGTSRSFSNYSDELLGSQTGHPASQLGPFFSESPEVAGKFTLTNEQPFGYGGKFRDGANIRREKINLKNPKEVGADEFRNKWLVSDKYTDSHGFQVTPEDIKRKKQQLIEEGYDGLIIKGDGNKSGLAEWSKDQYVPFFPNEQIAR